MINYENIFLIDYLDESGEYRLERYEANQNNQEKDLRDKISRMKKDGHTILEVRRVLGKNWVKFIH